MNSDTIVWLDEPRQGRITNEEFLLQTWDDFWRLADLSFRVLVATYVISGISCFVDYMSIQGIQWLW